MDYIAIFYNHGGAIKFSKNLSENGVKGELIPAPRKLTSNCNIACRFSYDKNLENIIIEEVEKILLVKNKEVATVYEDYY